MAHLPHSKLARSIAIAFELSVFTLRGVLPMISGVILAISLCILQTVRHEKSTQIILLGISVASVTLIVLSPYWRLNCIPTLFCTPVFGSAGVMAPLSVVTVSKIIVLYLDWKSVSAQKKFSFLEMVSYCWNPTTEIIARKTSDEEITNHLKFGVAQLTGMGAIKLLLDFQILTNIYLMKQFYCLLILYWSTSGFFHLDACCWGILTGNFIKPMFYSPLESTSLRDLWGRRWNTWFHEFSRRVIFTPFKKNGIPGFLASFCVFSFAAIFHEFIILLSHPDAPYLGYMSLFFFVQAVATTAQHFVTESKFWKSFPDWLKQKWMSTALVIIWGFISSPLFLKPYFAVPPWNAYTSF